MDLPLSHTRNASTFCFCNSFIYFFFIYQGGGVNLFVKTTRINRVPDLVESVFRSRHPLYCATRITRRYFFFFVFRQLFHKDFTILSSHYNSICESMVRGGGGFLKELKSVLR